MKKSFLILAVVLMVGVIAGCNPSPTGPTPACALCAQQTQTEVAKIHATETAIALIAGTATATNVVIVNTATVTSTSNEVATAPVNTATATMTSTNVIVLPTATATVTVSLRQYYVTVASLSSTESSFTAYVGVWNGNVIYPESSYSIQAPAPYYYVCTSDVVNTNSFHFEGICASQAVRVRAYVNGVAFWGVDVSANTPFGVNQ